MSRVVLRGCLVGRSPRTITSRRGRPEKRELADLLHLRNFTAWLASGSLLAFRRPLIACLLSFHRRRFGRGWSSWLSRSACRSRHARNRFFPSRRGQRGNTRSPTLRRHWPRLPAWWFASIGTETVEGKDVFKLETRANDVVQKTELITLDERGVFCLRRTSAHGKSVSFEPPQRLLPAELKLGAKWELDDEVAGTEMHQQFTVAAEEDVVVPAGTFHAYRFEAEEPWPISITIQRWFAPGTGFVKDITTTRGPSGRLLSRVTKVLKKFSPTAAPLPNESPTSSPASSSASLSPTMTITVAKEHDGEPTTEFRSNAPNIFVRWQGEHLPVDGDGPRRLDRRRRGRSCPSELHCRSTRDNRRRAGIARSIHSLAAEGWLGCREVSRGGVSRW